TTRPVVSARGPPELPGASRRSAWIQRPPERDTGKPCTTPAVSVRRRRKGWPTATTRAPTRRASESVESAGAISTPATRSSARSARRSAAIRLASICRSSASPTRTREARATCALVTTRSGAHRMPAPPPPAPEISTVICWRRSAIRARCGGGPPGRRARTARRLHLPGLAAAHDAGGDAVAHAVRLQHGDQIAGLGDRVSRDRDDAVAYAQSRRSGRAVRGDVHDDDRRSLGQAETLPKIVRQHDGLRADAEVRPRNPAAPDDGVRQSRARGGGDRALRVPGRAGRRDADDAAEHIHERPAGEARIDRETHPQH